MYLASLKCLETKNVVSKLENYHNMRPRQHRQDWATKRNENKAKPYQIHNSKECRRQAPPLSPPSLPVEVLNHFWERGGVHRYINQFCSIMNWTLLLLLSDRCIYIIHTMMSLYLTLMSYINNWNVNPASVFDICIWHLNLAFWRLHLTSQSGV